MRGGKREGIWQTLGRAHLRLKTHLWGSSCSIYFSRVRVLLPGCIVCIFVCVFVCMCVCGRVWGTCLIIPCHCLGGCCSWISHWPCKNSQLKQERDSSHLWSDLFTYFSHQRAIEHMLSAAYNYNGTPSTAVALASLLILFIIRDLTCELAEISRHRLFCSTQTFYFGVCVCVRAWALVGCLFYSGSVSKLGEVMDCS